jgi:hypothetical protein
MVCLRSGLRPSLRHTTRTVPQLSHEHWYRNREGVNSSPRFQLRVDVLFVILASLPVLGLYHIVLGCVKTESGDVYVCTKPILDYARQSLLADVSIVVVLLCLHWWGQLPGQ